MCRLLYVVVLLFIFLNLHGQNYPNLIHYKPDPQRNGQNINRFFLDKDGHVVLKCGNTHYYFEGNRSYPYRFTPHFVPDNLETMVRKVVTVSDTLTWFISYYDGVIRVNSRDKKFDFFPSGLSSCSFSTDKIQHVIATADGRLYFTQYNNAFYGYDPDKNCFTHYQPSEYLQVKADSSRFSNRVRMIVADPKYPDLIWLGTDDGLLSFSIKNEQMQFHPFTGEKRLVENTPIMHICFLDNDRIAMSSWEEGVRIFDRDKGAWSVYPFPHVSITEEERCVGGLVPLNDSVLLVNYRYHGLYALDHVNKTHTKYIGHVNDMVISRVKLRGEISEMFKGDDGVLWIRQTNGIISAIFPQAQHVHTFDYNANVNEVFRHPITKDLFIGTNGPDLIKQEFQSGHRIRYHVIPSGQSGEESDLEDFFYTPDGELIILGNRDVYKINEINHTVEPIHPVAWRDYTDNNGEAYEFHLDKHGYWWIPMKFDGLLRMNDFEKKVNPIVITDQESGAPKPWTYWTDIVESQKGTMWLSCERGLAASKDGGDTFDLITGTTPDQEGNPFGVIREIALDHHDRLWVTTDKGDIGYIRNASEPPFQVYRIPHRVADLRDIVVDEENNLWVLAMNDLCKINGDHLEIECYSADFGMALRGCHKIDLLETGEGSSQLVTICGQQVSFIDYSQFIAPDQDRNIEIVAIKKHNKEWESIKGNNDCLVFQPGENYLSFRFQVPGVWNIRNISIEHRIPQLNKEWTSAGNVREVNYTNLAGGHYQFEIRAIDRFAKNVTSTSEILAFDIKKAFHETFWFKLVIGLGAVGLLVAFWRLKIQQIRSEENLKRESFEREEKIKSDYQRKLIDLEMAALRAQMNPHFLFNSLNSIKRYILDKEFNTASKYLEQFADLLRQVLNNTREKFVPLADEIKVIKLYVDLEKMRLKDRFHFNINIDPKIDQDYLLIPPMLFQPFVENAIWHGLMHKEDGDGHLDIAIKAANGTIKCTIKDDGIGREEASQIKTQSKAKYKSVSTQITAQRLDFLRQIYGAESSIEIHDLQDPTGTMVVITLPWYEEGM